MIVMAKEDAQRIAQKMLDAVRGENLREVQVALCGLHVAVGRALHDPDEGALGGIRMALQAPAVRELTPLVEAIEWTR